MKHVRESACRSDLQLVLRCTTCDVGKTKSLSKKFLDEVNNVLRSVQSSQQQPQTIIR